VAQKFGDNQNDVADKLLLGWLALVSHTKFCVEPAPKIGDNKRHI
jgi:hypothetical protein